MNRRGWGGRWAAVLVACAALLGTCVPAAGQATAPADRPGDPLTVRVLSDEAPVTADGKVIATAGKGDRFGVISVRAGAVEVQVCREDDFRRGWIDARHVAPLADKDIDLARESLLMTRVLNPKMDLGAYAARLDALVGRLVAAAAKGKTPRERLGLVGVQLFEREGFRTPKGGPFTTEAYFANAMDGVLERKVGACLSFSVVYLAAARRMGLPLRMVMMPGHVAVCYDDGRERFFVETTEQGRIYDDDKYLAELMRIALPGGYRGIAAEVLPHGRASGVLVQYLATALSVARRYDQAGRIFPRALETNPESVEAYLNWGIYLDSTKRPEAACRMYARCVELAPQCPYAQFCWAGALVGMGKLAGACEKLEQVCRLAPTFGPAYERRGMLLARMGKPGEACEMYEKVVELRPDYVAGYIQWSSALLEAGETKKACEVCARAAKIAPRNALVHYSWGGALAIAGDFEEACRKYETAVQLKPDYAGAYFSWGVALAMLGRKAEAADKLDQAVKLDAELKARADELRKKLGL